MKKKAASAAINLIQAPSGTSFTLKRIVEGWTASAPSNEKQPNNKSLPQHALKSEAIHRSPGTARDHEEEATYIYSGG